MASPSILRIERLNYGIGAVLAIASLITQSRPIALGVAVGVALTCINFFMLRRLIVKWTTDAAGGKTGHAPFLMLPKMVGMMAAVAAAVLLLPINVIAFTIGYSIFIVSIIVETIYSSIIVGSSEDAPNGNANGNE